MKRKEGIIKRWQEGKRPGPTKSMTELLKSEYANYTDNCYYCYEEPLSFTEWTEQTIKEAKQ